MKKLLLLVLLFTGISMSSVVFGQQVVTTVDTSDPNTCDGSATITDSTIYENSTSWQGSGVVYQTGGYSIDSLCPGTYVLTYTNFLGTYSYTFTIGTDPCGGFSTPMGSSNSSDSLSCDGVAVIEVVGGAAPYTYNWSNGFTTSDIDNLCPGIYYCTVADANGCTSTVSCYIGVGINPCAGFNSTISQTNATDSLTCDGSAIVQGVGGTAPYTFNWSNGTTTQINDNLCYGNYSCTVTDANGCTDTYGCSIGVGTPDPCAGFYSSISQTNSGDSVTCDGSTMVIVGGGTAPYSYNWSNGSTISYINNLCPGIYYCTVSDANGCTNTTTCSIGAYTTSNDTMIIINNGTYPDSTIIDTLGNSWVENCVMDFLFLDSAYISNYGYSSLDSIWVIWTLVDTNGLVVIELTTMYGITGTTNGVYTTFLTIFCPQKNTDYHYLQASDQVYLNPSQMGIEEENNFDFTVTNPFDNQITITLDEARDITVEIVDLKGSLVYSGKGNNTSEWTINTEKFNAGSFFLRLNDGNSTVIKKLIK